jgi:8-oxo-dGTP diphosphatase
MKTIAVSAAIILDPQGRIFATQRGYGPWKDWWEFPGGKIEPGETPEDALIREIREELAVHIEIDGFDRTVEWDYPDFHLVLHCFFCHITEGSPNLLEHEAARWLAPDELASVQWLPADKELVEELQNESYKLPSAAPKEQDGNNPIPTQRSMGGKPSIP